MTDIDTTKPDPKMNDILSEIEKWELSLFENQTFVESDVYLDGSSNNQGDSK